MLLLLSPAKSLDYETALPQIAATTPLFAARSAELITTLQKKSARQIVELMDLSEALATLNVQRYKSWSPEFSEDNARPAVLAFNGDVYEGLNAKSLTPKQLQWAQSHVAILSGLYGVLRPLDLMQPYRLEMGTALKHGKSNNLYQFWGGSNRGVPEPTTRGRQRTGDRELGVTRIFQSGRQARVASTCD